jgi:uncharacterized protein YndB with AHSA1/START domain
MSNSETTMTVEPGKQEVLLTWTFDAPRQLVFRAYTDPQMIPKWWGPRELATTVERFDTQPGGIWRVVQHDPEGNEHAFHGVFHEVSPPQRIVRTFEYEGAPGRVLLETVTFAEVNGRTRLTTLSVFQTAADRDEMVDAGMERGVVESMERLTQLIAQE